MEWAAETLVTAASYLTLAAAFARGAAVRNDAKLLAAAVEHELAAVCEPLTATPGRPPERERRSPTAPG
jgi:hypothetical protein